MTEYAVRFSRRMTRDEQRMRRRGKDMSKLERVITVLQQDATPPPSLRDHGLRGSWSKYRECHIEADWVLVYRKDGQRLILMLMATGSHTDVFR